MLEEVKVGLELKKSIKDMFKYIDKTSMEKSEKVEIEAGTIFDNYLKKLIKQYGEVKTIFSSDKPVPLYSFYEPMNLSQQNKEINIERSEDLTDFILRKKFLSIQGTGGMGKSIFMKRVLIDFIQKSANIPIFIELKTLNECEDEESFENFIFKNVSNLGLKISQKNFLESLKSGKYIFLFDGYDEINYKIINNINDVLKQFISKYDANLFIISSRPGVSFSSWTTFEEFDINPLDKTKVLNLAKKLMNLGNVKNNFLNSIEEKLYDTHKEFLSVPLLLTIMLITYQEAGEIPDNHTEFYEYCYNALFYKHDASKGLKRELKTKLSESEFQKILNYIGIKSFTASKVNFDRSYIDYMVNESCKYYKYDNTINSDDFIDDATTGICMLISEGNSFKFSHRSFQEFFAACFTIHQKDEFFKNKLVPWMRKSKFNFDSHATFIDTIQNKAYNHLIEDVIYPYARHIYDEMKNLDYYELVRKYILEFTFSEEDNHLRGYSYLQETVIIFSFSEYLENKLNFSSKRNLFGSQPRSLYYQDLDGERLKFKQKLGRELGGKRIKVKKMSNEDLDLVFTSNIGQLVIKKLVIIKEWYQSYEKQPLNFEIEF